MSTGKREFVRAQKTNVVVMRQDSGWAIQIQSGKAKEFDVEAKPTTNRFSQLQDHDVWRNTAPARRGRGYSRSPSLVNLRHGISEPRRIEGSRELVLRASDVRDVTWKLESVPRKIRGGAIFGSL